MSYSHSFSPEFYWGEGSPKESDRPTNVADALASMSDREWDEMATEVFGVPGERLDIDTVMAKIEETDTVGDLSVPVDVWIDDEGWYTVDVYDEADEDELERREQEKEDRDMWADEHNKFMRDYMHPDNATPAKPQFPKKKSKLRAAVDYLKLGVWDEPAIQKDKYSEPMSLPESLGGSSDITSKDDPDDGPLRERRPRRNRDDSGQRPRRQRPERLRLDKDECPRKAFPFNNEDKEIREEGKVTENLPMAIEKLYVVEEDTKKRR